MLVQAIAVSFGVATFWLLLEACVFCHCRPWRQASVFYNGKPRQALAGQGYGFLFASAGQGYKLWDCHCRPRLQALGLLLLATVTSFCFCPVCRGRPRLQALGLLVQAMAASFCFLLWQAEASFGVASAGQGCKLWDCQCRPRQHVLIV